MNDDLARRLGGYALQQALDQMEAKRREAIRLGLSYKLPVLPAASDIQFVKRGEPRFIDPVVRLSDSA